MHIRTATLAALVAVLPLAACSYTDPDASAVRSATVTALAEQPTAVVHKSATCECCSGHEAHLREHGYDVEEVVYDDYAELNAFKGSLGIPGDRQSCHTTLIDGYAVEGHVPVEEIELLLAERPAVDGIALPGMPSGAPGMPGVKDGPWEIWSFTDGEAALHRTR